jgi:hypothetical protein
VRSQSEQGMPASVAARAHRVSQLENQAGIADLTADQKRQLIRYIKKHAKSLGACQHLVAIHKRVPHPKYGDAVAHFETAEAPDPMNCPCEEAKRFRATLVE